MNKEFSIEILTIKRVFRFAFLVREKYRSAQKKILGIISTV